MMNKGLIIRLMLKEWTTPLTRAITMSETFTAFSNLGNVNF